MTKEAKEPVKMWGYRMVDGTVESEIFEDKLPKGWKDTPAALKVK